METISKTGKSKTAKKTIAGSEAVILSLIKEGVDTVFGYPGGAIMPIYDAVYNYQEQLRHILVRHEQGAAHAAQGYARVTGRVGVCFATSGPGATNLITGIADAQIDSTPIVCITGQVPAHLLGSDAFQETDVVGISMPVTKWNFQVTKASEIPEAIAKAFYIAGSGRPGPVLVDITKNAQIEAMKFQYRKCKGIRSYQPIPDLDLAQVVKAADLINHAKKPFLLCGHGVLIAHADRDLSSFLEKTGIPAASTLLGLSALATDHPNNMGFLGMHGNYGPNVKTNECDVLIAVGMRFDDRVTGDLNTYAKQAKVIHIEIDQSEIDKNVKADIAINADAKEALQALIQEVKPNSFPNWTKEFHDCAKIEYDQVIKGQLYPEEGAEIRMGEVIRIVSEITEGEAIIVTDVGQHQMVASRYYNFKNPHSNVTSGGLGTMGFALPAAFGAQIGQPKRPVVAIIGDGGIQMTIQELGTIFQYQTPTKIIILNNNFLGMVRQWQQLFFEKRYSSTELVNPRFEMIARAYGIEASKVSERRDLTQALRELIDHEGPYLLDIQVEKEENVFPMVPSGESVANIRLK